MKQLFKQASILYFSFFTVMTAFIFASLALGYRFIVSNGLIWFIVNLAVVAVFTKLCLDKRNEPTKTSLVIEKLLPLSAFIYLCAVALFIEHVNAFLLPLYAVICSTACFIISVQSNGKRLLQILSTVVNSIALIIIWGASFFIMTFGQIGQTTVVRELTSPAGTYTVIVIDSDQGALGGDTIVEVENHTFEINFGLGRYVRVSRLYVGDWGEFETMRLEWASDDILMIDGVPYLME